MNIIAFVCKYMKFFSNEEIFLHKIYKILNEIGCAKARKAQYNILNVLFFTIAENFSFKNFSIQIEISNFARNKDKESENRILYKKRFRIRKR